MMKKIFTLLLVLACFTNAKAQLFSDDIRAFKKADSIAFPPKNAILFIGSSSFTKWQDVQNYFPKHKIINRGFGGSTLLDVTKYIDDIVLPYHPKQIVIYCGENDLANDETVTPEMVCVRAVQLINKIRIKLPQVPMIYISLKPSPSRWYLKDKMVETNSLIQKYTLTTQNIKFINVYDKMLSNDKKPKQDIFLPDNLHMNAKGYTIWKNIIEPNLLK